MKKSYQSNTFTLSISPWNEEPELPDHIMYHIFKIILSTSSKIMKYLQITLQSKYISRKFNIELHSTVNHSHQKLRSYFKAKKTKKQNN